MRKITLIVFVTSILICFSNNSIKAEMGIFDKLFGKKEASTKPAQSSDVLMDSENFWTIIESSKMKGSGDYKLQQSALQKELTGLKSIEIIQFDNKFRTLRGSVYNWDFWAAAYIINGGCSDDCFSDFRGWLIGKGQAVFESAINDIESLVQLSETNDGDWEGLSYIPSTAYENKTGHDMPDGIRENFEIAGEEWDEEGSDLKERYPKLWARFGQY